MPGMSHGASQPAAAERVFILDTTLRDGEQAPGFSMSAEDKVVIAGVLRDLGVDIIEAGFASASSGDAEAIKRIAGEIEGPILCSLARANTADIDAAYEALRAAPRRRIHVFLSTSPIHRAAKLNMSAAAVTRAVVESVGYARSLVEDVEFSAEDATRTEPEFLAEIMVAAAEAGARTLNLPDTVGYSTPEEIGAMFEATHAALGRRTDIVLSAHCHDDLGLAVANTLAAVRHGARQVEVALNGIGERAGNCALEEIVMALRTRADRYGLTTGIDTTKLLRASRTLSARTRQPVARNKAIVGDNAFAHEAGIHQHGMIVDPRTYQIMRPEDVGFGGAKLVLGKHSGRRAIAQRAEMLGHRLDAGALHRVFVAFKRRADAIGEIDDVEFGAILAAARSQPSGSENVVPA